MDSAEPTTVQSDPNSVVTEEATNSPAAQLAQLHAQADEVAEVPAPSLASTSKAPSRKKPTATTTVPDLTSEDAFPSLTSTGTKAVPKWGGGSGVALTSSWNNAPPSLNAKQVPPPHSVQTPRQPQQQHQQPQATNGIVTKNFEIPPEQQLNKITTSHGKNSSMTAVKNIMSTTGTDITVSTGRSGTITFLIKGPVDAVDRARRELFSRLATKTSIQMQIPTSTRPFIIGTRGRTLNNIQELSGTKIQMPPREESKQESGERTEENGEEEEDEPVSITITGDPEGIKIARAEIERIVNERTQKLTSRLTNIDPKFFPLIAGAHNKNIAHLEEETSTRIRVPHLHKDYDDNDAINGSEESAKLAITVSGDRENVKKAIDAIQEFYDEIKATSTTMTIDVSKRQHRYLVRKGGAVLAEILEATDCFVEIPPQNDPSEKIIIRGPKSHLGQALQMVLEKANLMQFESLDLTSIHKVAGNDGLKHAQNVLRYLTRKGKFKKFESDHGVTILLPHRSMLESSATVDIEGKDKNAVETARREITEAIRELIPVRFGSAVVEPHLRRHVIGRKGDKLIRIKQTYGVDVIVPDDGDSNDKILIVYEGKDDEPLPTDKKARDAKVKEVLEASRAELERLASVDSANFATQTITIPVKFHKTIIGPKGTTLNAIIGDSENPVSVRFGSSTSEANSRKEEIPEDAIVIRGSQEEVNRVVADIKKLYEEAKHTDIMNSYTLEFAVPAQFYGNIVGKGGANITKLREQLGVKIDIEGSNKDREANGNPALPKKPGEKVNVTIQGPKKNAEAAKERILELTEKLADETTERLIVLPKFHPAIIGPGGKYVRRLEEKYGVRIKFPKSPTTRDDGSDNDDTQSDKGKERENDKLKPNEVLIKGGKKGVAQTKSEILELIEYEKENSQVATVSFNARHLPHVVGRGGSRLNEIKDSTNCRIDFDTPSSDPGDPSERIVTGTIIGTKEGIAETKEAILKVVAEFESQATIILKIDPTHHRYLIGPGGTHIREIISRSGGTSDATRMVNFPKAGGRQAPDEVLLKGDRVIVEKIKAELEALVEEHINRTIISFFVPPSEHPGIIGRGGNNLKDIQRKYKVDIEIPKGKKGDFPVSSSSSSSSNTEEAGQEESADGMIKISGREVDCEAAKKEILSKIPSTQEVRVPRKYHRDIVGNDRGLYRRLRNDHNVIISIAGPEPKPRQNSNAKKLKVNGNSNTNVARIDDEELVGKKEDYDFELYENVDDDEEETGDIIWSLRGDPKSIEKAEEIINNSLNELRKSTHTCYLTVPRQYHRHVIGRNGSNVGRIRDETGTRIDVPKNNNDDIVVITGDKDSVIAAKDMVIATIEKSKKDY